MSWFNRKKHIANIYLNNDMIIDEIDNGFSKKDLYDIATFICSKSDTLKKVNIYYRKENSNELAPLLNYNVGEEFTIGLYARNNYLR